MFTKRKSLGGVFINYEGFIQTYQKEDFSTHYFMRASAYVGISKHVNHPPNFID